VHQLRAALLDHLPAAEAREAGARKTARAFRVIDLVAGLTFA